MTLRGLTASLVDGQNDLLIRGYRQQPNTPPIGIMAQRIHPYRKIHLLYRFILTYRNVRNGRHIPLSCRISTKRGAQMANRSRVDKDRCDEFHKRTCRVLVTLGNDI